MVSLDWDLAPKSVCGPNFIFNLIGKSLILSATSNTQRTLKMVNEPPSANCLRDLASANFIQEKMINNNLEHAVRRRKGWWEPKTAPRGTGRSSNSVRPIQDDSHTVRCASYLLSDVDCIACRLML